MTKYFRFFPLAVLAILFGVNVHAFVPPAGMGTVFPPSVQGSTVTYGASTASAQNVGSTTISTQGGSVDVAANQSVNVGAGRSIGVTVRSRPSPADIARAVGNFAGKIATPLVIGGALWNLYKELGFEAEKTPEGTVIVRKPNSNVCTTAPCFKFQMAAALTGTDPAPMANTALEACTLWARHPARAPYFHTVRGVSGLSCALFDHWGYPYSMAINQVEVAPQAADYVDSSMKEFIDAVRERSGWPDTSALPKVLEEAVKAGEPLPLPQPYKVEGPLTVPLAPTVTTYPDGSKVTEQPQKNVSYGPNTVTVTGTSTRTETSPGGVTTPGATTTSAEPLPAQEKPKDPCGLPDTPACVVDGSNVPTAEELPDDQAKKTLNPVQDFLNNPFSLVPALPTINWAFALPTACGNIPTPAFAPYLTGVDVCQFQPMFHELMSMVWMLGGLFGAISLFMRSSLAD